MDADDDLKIQRAYAGCTAQLGPCIEDARLVLSMQPVDKHRETIYLNKCDSIEGCRTTFLDPQVTGIAWFLQRTLGTLPDRSEAYAEAEQAVKRILNNPVTGGVLCAEGTGLGKTKETAGALSLAVEQFATGPAGSHLPTFVVTPGGPVLEQWLKELALFPNLKVIISNDSKPPSAAQSLNWVTSHQMRNPDTEWPANLKYALDKNDPDASRTVIISPFDTHSARTLQLDEPLMDRLAGASRTGKARKRWKKRTTHARYFSVWADRVRLVIVDEAHKLRNRDTKFHASIKKLKAAFYWLITATPTLNRPKVCISERSRDAVLTSFRK